MSTCIKKTESRHAASLILSVCMCLQCASAGSNVLTYLDLAQNGIGDKGAVALAEALKLNTTILKLDLSGNAIDVDGAAALADAIALNETLEVGEGLGMD